MKLPEGTEILDLGEPAEKSVDVALEIAALGASDEMVRAVGGEEAVEKLRELREPEPAGASTGNGTPDSA